MIKGITLSVVASILFGAMYYFTSTLTPLNGEQVYGWRTLLTLPFLTLFMALSGDWRKVGDTLAWIGQRPLRLLGLLLTSALLGVQLWLFLWAPLHGKALDVSLGYFLLPLTMVLVGRLIYRDRLSLLQNWRWHAPWWGWAMSCIRRVACRGRRWWWRWVIRSTLFCGGVSAPTISAGCGASWR